MLQLIIKKMNDVNNHFIDDWLQAYDFTFIHFSSLMDQGVFIPKKRQGQRKEISEDH